MAVLLEYAPYVEDNWGHKMLVVFDKRANRSVGSSSPPSPGLEGVSAPLVAYPSSLVGGWCLAWRLEYQRVLG